MPPARSHQQPIYELFSACAKDALWEQHRLLESSVAGPIPAGSRVMVLAKPRQRWRGFPFRRLSFCSWCLAWQSLPSQAGAEFEMMRYRNLSCIISVFDGLFIALKLLHV